MIKTISTHDLPHEKRILKVQRQIEALRKALKVKTSLGEDTSEIKADLALLQTTKHNLEKANG